MEFEIEEPLVDEQWRRPSAEPRVARPRPAPLRPSQWGVWIPEECVPEDEGDLRSGLVAVA